MVSPLLVEELGEVLARAKFRRWFTEQEAERFVGDLLRIADEVTDPPAARAQRVQAARSFRSRPVTVEAITTSPKWWGTT